MTVVAHIDEAMASGSAAEMTVKIRGQALVPSPATGEWGAAAASRAPARVIAKGDRAVCAPSAGGVPRCVRSGGRCAQRRLDPRGAAR